MINLKSILFSTFLFTFFSYSSVGQQTYMAAAEKMSSLLETKYLKTGELVLVEQIKLCRNTSVKILNLDGSEEIALTSGRALFISFNELADSNWVLVIITDPQDDVPEPLTFHTITFIDGEYSIFNTDDNQTSVDLTKVSGSTVINGDELVLNAGEYIYFTDFQLNSIHSVLIEKPIIQLKTYNPIYSNLYFRHFGEDKVLSTSDKFENIIELYTDLGDSFQEFHYLGNVAIFQYENKLFRKTYNGNVYFENNNKIYNFRQHGQGLTYYTISPSNPDIIFFHKIYSKEFGSTSREVIVINTNDHPTILNLHWDGAFRGYNYEFIPLPSQDYADKYSGFNYVLNYNFQDNDLTSQNKDVSIDDIEYTTSVDTMIFSDVTVYYADIIMEVTITNNTDQSIADVHLHSTAFDGVNCGYNILKVEDNIISLLPNESKDVNAKYETLIFDNQDFHQDPLCVYIIGANNKFDDSFNDNIYCLPLSEFTSTEDELEETTFTVFPNPAYDNIQVESNTINSEYHIYTLQGKKVVEWKRDSSNKILDISDLIQGTYLIIEQKTNKTRLFSKI